MPTRGPSADKVLHLESATNNLTRSVDRLTDVFGRLNNDVNQLRDQVNQKADSAEVTHKVAATADRVRAERRRILRRVTLTIMIACTLSSFIAYSIVNHESIRRCQANAKQSETLISILQSFDPDGRNPAISGAIDKLHQNKVEC